MSERIHSEKTGRANNVEDLEQTEFPTQPTTEIDSAEIDAVLDEIDGILETNAEEFVLGFVQKGGQ